MKWVVLVLGLASSGCFQAVARLDIEDYESRIERYTAATLLPDSGPADYVAVRTRSVALPIDRFDARVRRAGDAVVIITSVGEEVRVPLAEVEDVEIYRGRATIDETVTTSTDALSIGLVMTVIIGFFAVAVSE